MSIGNFRVLLSAVAALSLLISATSAGASPLSPRVAASNLPAPTASESMADKMLLDDHPPAEAVVNLHLTVPVKDKSELKKLLMHFAAYPYPVKPPKNDKPNEKLPDTAFALEGRMFASGYAARQHYMPYPQFGWRWDYCFKAAVRRKGGDLPKTIVGVKSWTKDMVKYMKPEVERMNELEDVRQQMYEKVCEEYDRRGIEAESEATRNGLTPMNIRFDFQRRCTIKVAPGEWWFVGTYKVPGLTYFWELPVNITADQPNNIDIGEANAVLIQGGW